MALLKKAPLKSIILAIFISLLTLPSMAQDAFGDGEELSLIEVELEGSKPALEVDDKSSSRVAPDDMGEDDKPIDFQGLGQLAPFAEVSVLQKRFMPKTKRFQLFGGLTLVTNDPFFNVMGAVGKLGFFFNESLGVELNYFGLSTSEAKSTKELKEINGVRTNSLVSTKNFTGVDLVYVPIYGKMTWFNETIIPFDLYMSLGTGLTTTQSESASTIHLATGQIFALSKSTAFRWDFSWNFFTATGVDEKKSTYNNLFMTVGWSWFFPEANYR